MNLTRRYFLRSSAALAAYTAVSPLRLLADAGIAGAPLAPVRHGKTLVAVFLRGGMDGLNFIVPHGDRAYAGLRKVTALAGPGASGGVLDLDGFFGLHPKAAALAPLFATGHAAALQAVGYAENTRSHFEEQDTWETGVHGNTIHSDGWLNRHLLTSAGRGPVRALSIGDTLPRILRGPAPALAVRGLTELMPAPGQKPGDALRAAAALEHAYCAGPRPAANTVADAQELLAQTARTTLEGEAALRAALVGAYKPAAEYPATDFARRLADAARLIKSGLGLEVIELDLGGWDTHQNQGGADGQYARLVQTLSEGLAAFTRDLGPLMDDVLVLTMSDFGRTAAENGTAGTDHGWANCMLALGGPVRAASSQVSPRVLGSWPGLAPEQLHQGRDLQHTTDFRDVLGEVVARHLGNPHLQTVLPGHEFQSVGLV